MTIENTPGTHRDVVLTRDHVLACRCADRAWTREAVRLLAGDQWIDRSGRLVHGWFRHAIGRSIPVEQYEQAMGAKSASWHRRQSERLQATLGLDVSNVAQVVDHDAGMVMPDAPQVDAGAQGDPAHA